MAEMFENVGFKNPTYRITFILRSSKNINYTR